MMKNKTMKQLESLLEFNSDEEKQELRKELKSLEMENKTPEEILGKITGLTITDDMVRMQTEISYLLQAMKEYGNQQYDQAIKDAAESAKIRFIPFSDNIEIDEDSILKLLK